jgi:hypothetical protein
MDKFEEKLVHMASVAYSCSKESTVYCFEGSWFPLMYITAGIKELSGCGRFAYVMLVMACNGGIADVEVYVSGREKGYGFLESGSVAPMEGAGCFVGVDIELCG